MLKKLIKNEFKENYKEMLVLYGISLIAFCLLGLFIRLDMFDFLTILVIPAVGSMYCIMIFIFININRSFNKKLFSKEGYLTFSLPVKMGNLLFSKYLSNIIWMFASFIVLLIDVVFLLIFAGAAGLDFLEIDLQYSWFYLLACLYYFIFLVLYLILFLTAILVILCFLNVGKIKKHKVLIGILFFYGLSTAFSFCISLFNIIPYDIRFSNHQITIVNVGFRFLEFGLGGFSVLNNMVFVSILIVGGIFVARFLLEKKIELE